MANVRTRIAALCKDLPRGWQAELARACGVKPASVNGWLSGSQIKSEHIFSAADFFKVNARWLATGKGPVKGDVPVPTEREWPFPDTALHEQIERLHRDDRVEIQGQLRRIVR